MRFFKKTVSMAGTEVNEAWLSSVSACLKTCPLPYQAIHPHNDLPIDQLESLAALLDNGIKVRDNPVVHAFLGMFIRSDSYEADVGTRLIQAIGNSEGKAKFDVYRLPESIRFTETDQSFGPLSVMQAARLCKSIKNHSGAFNPDGRIRLFHQSWDNIYIVRNTGTARRLALWLRLQGYNDYLCRPPATTATIQACVTPISLNESSLECLARVGRIVIVQHDDDVEACVTGLASHHVIFSYTKARVTDGTFIGIIILPQLKAVGSLMYDGLLDLHNWADRFFDVRRYVLERTSTYRNV